MAACEKCWGDAFGRMYERGDGRSQTDHYLDLLRERKERPCSPEEQRGGAETAFIYRGHPETARTRSP